jgi:pantoate--beta-alanine ligase
VRIEVAPTVRESDGVAMSSRNKHLVGDLRAQASVLIRSIAAVRQLVCMARRPVPVTRLKARVLQVIRTAPAAKLDYVEFFDPGTLVPVPKAGPGTHMALAVFVGRTRLIDNAEL